MIEYPQQNKIPKYYAKYKIAEFLLEDIPEGDITTSGIFKGTETSIAIVQAQEDLVFVGEEYIFYFFDDSFKFELLVKDGDWVRKDGIIARIQGNTGHILTRERVMLNIMQRMCGIGTLTRKFVDIAKPFNVKILDTRKTTPGMRLFEKHAVVAGGGYNHRLDLSSGILIKDNHIQAAGSVKNAIERIRLQNYKLPIELEVDNIEQIKEALPLEIDGFLLDNFSPELIKQAVEIIRSAKNGKDMMIEASGGININTVANYVDTGIDAISVGALTHSAKASNIHIEFTN